MSRFVLVAALLVALTAVVSCRKGDGPDTQERGDAQQKYEALTRQLQEQGNEIEALEQQNRDLLEQASAAAEELKSCKEKLSSTADVEALKQQLLTERSRAEELQQKVKELSAAQGATDTAEKLETREGELRALQDRACRIAEGLDRVASGAFGAGDYQVALALLMAVAELGADSADIRFRVGYCFGRAGDWQEALNWYGTAIEGAKGDEAAHAELLKKAHVNSGAALARLKRPQEALNHYQKAIELDERYAPVYFNLGLLYQGQLDNPEAAIEAFRRHIVLGGSRAAAARDAIVTLQSPGEPESDSQEPE